MKEKYIMTTEQKARAYDEALEKAKKWYNAPNIDKIPTYGNRIIEEIFPELKESEDERIRKNLLEWFEEFPDMIWRGHYKKDVIAWLEKYGNIDKASYEIAEKEKYDFVSGQFIECRKSFDEFKEDNSYWFEYIGNDTYIGRSDNIINKKFHITPRQLYRLFTQQHCPKENNVNEETNGPTAYGKYVDECLYEAAKHFFSEGEDKYTVADLFYAGIRCGQTWLEKQGGQKHIFDFQAKDWYVSKVDGKIYNAKFIEKQDKQKPTNKVKPKFHPGDWVVHNKANFVFKVISVSSNSYGVVNRENHKKTISFNNENKYHIWTIQDAKDGDVLVHNNCTFIFMGIKNGIVNALEENLLCDTNPVCFGEPDKDNDYHPATKEQRDLLFQKMKEAGYEWDAEKKELIKQTLKITPKFCVGQLITDDNGTFYKITNIECLDD